VGSIALLAVTTGFENTAVGAGALDSITTGACNTAIGRDAQAIISTQNNTIAVGRNALTTANNNHTVWGNANNNACNCVYAAWTNVSDCRDKANIQTLPDQLGLALIKRLRPVKYNWDHRDSYVLQCSYTYGQKDGNLVSVKEHYGIIAQELKATLEELNVKYDALGHDPEKDAYRMTYEELIAPMIKAIQELDARITTLEQNSGN
jgi:hypothetical protein